MKNLEGQPWPFSISGQIVFWQTKTELYHLLTFFLQRNPIAEYMHAQYLYMKMYAGVSYHNHVLPRLAAHVGKIITMEMTLLKATYFTIVRRMLKLS